MQVYSSKCILMIYHIASYFCGVNCKVFTSKSIRKNSASVIYD